MLSKVKRLTPTMRLVYLDAIRAVLSVLVLLYHWGLTKLVSRLLPALTGGAWGLAVDYFFLLSGFVLCLSLSRRRMGVFRFVAIRAFRLLPVAAAALALWLVVNAFSSPPAFASWGEVFANLFLLQPFVSERSLPATMWSASYEMWLPSLFCCFGFLRVLGVRFLVVVLIAFLFFQGQVDSSPMVEETAGWGGLARAVSGLGSGFFMGSVFLRVRDQLLPDAAFKYLWCGGFFFASALGSLLLAPDFRLLGFLFPFSAALSIFFLTAAECGAGCAFPSVVRGLVEFFGTRSYSIYLIHLPLIDLSSHVFGDSLSGNAPLKLALIGLTLVVSDAVYRFIEAPGYRLRKNFRVLA